MQNRIPQPNDYVHTQWKRGRNIKETWEGKVRRTSDEMALIEWSYCGGLPTDICTWVFHDELRVTRRLKNG